MKTPNFELLPQTPEHLLKLIEGADVFEKYSGFKIAGGIHEMMTSGDVSEDYLAMLKNAPADDPWTFGFLVRHIAENLVIGSCGFTGPPDSVGIVEIAYCIAPDYRGRGFATEAARALVAHALDDRAVRVIRAHTLPEGNASTRVLAKAGFRFVGEANDPEDGAVWRWEYDHATR